MNKCFEIDKYVIFALLNSILVVPAFYSFTDTQDSIKLKAEFKSFTRKRITSLDWLEKTKNRSLH